MSVLRAGYCAFLISTRNSLPAVLHLLGKTACQYIISGTNDEHEKLLVKGVREAQPNVEVIKAPLYAEVFTPDPKLELLPPMEKPALDQRAVIIHSSGTTNFPKPIPLTVPPLSLLLAISS
jgi:acyl-CoA synthetase (AMP-forming)/AMP-acid ligase II